MLLKQVACLLSGLAFLAEKCALFVGTRHLRSQLRRAGYQHCNITTIFRSRVAGVQVGFLAMESTELGFQSAGGYLKAVFPFAYMGRGVPNILLPLHKAMHNNKCVSHAPCRRARSNESKVYGASVMGVGVGAIAFHASSGKARSWGRKLDYWVDTLQL
jgi:hypothetical protein